MKNYFAIMLPLCILLACAKENDSNPKAGNQSITEQLINNYTQLPEQAIATNTDKSVYAQYAMPTQKYSHGILGDQIEAEQLVVVVDSIFYEFTLQENYVFEDIQPRLYDVDGDNELEFITIRTHLSQGAGIAIYKLIDKELVEYAYVSEIGTSNRWLNIASINDLDNDGIVELVWVETPHIGGILKVAKINGGSLQVLSEKSQYSNHAIGERNLCLSVLSLTQNEKTIYLPNQNRNKIVGFALRNNDLNIVEEIDQIVDFSQTLNALYAFDNLIEDEINCINYN